jgi:histidine triad (HIT) family protein
MPARSPDQGTGCVFCSIIAGRLPATVVVETPLCVGFLDTRPLFVGHTLVVPRAHLVTLADLDADHLVDLMTTGQRLSRAVVSGLGAQGSFVAMNNTVSQSVPHLHLHVVPRTKGDGLRGFFWPRTRYRDGEMDEVAARLRGALDAIDR